MKRALWYLFVGSRGGTNRVRITKSIDERPRNANQIAEDIDVDYNTVRYHLDRLQEHDVVEQEQEGYGALYFLTETFEHHREDFEDILTHVQ